MAGGPTRRAVLAASAAAVPLLATGCRGVQVLGSPPPPAPDVRLLQSVIAAEQLMIARYRAVLAGPGRGTAAAPGLVVLLAEHQQHLARLRERLIIPAGSAQSVPPARPSAGTTTSPPDLLPALAALAADEDAAAQRLTAGLLTVPPGLAQLLASISASEATHVPALAQLRRTA